MTAASPFSRRLDLTGTVELFHGGGGRAMAQLNAELFRKHLRDVQDGDAALLPPVSGRLAVTTDASVVAPRWFPGGDMGSLAINGTVNDLAMRGARPLALTVSMVLEEGLPLQELERLAQSLAASAAAVPVPVVAGDTKVVERGKGDGVFLSVAGVGVVPDGVTLEASAIRPGDRVLVSGTLGDHGMTLMSLREGLGFAGDLQSDCQPLVDLVASLLAVSGVRCLRDPTRGGLAATVNELAWAGACGFLLDETAIPIRPTVQAAGELLGIDPLTVANEGKLVAIVAPDAADRLLTVARAHPKGRDAALIGTVTDDPRHFVQLKTELGGTRILDWLMGEQLPRIC
ncbi:MAG: hydrogenase expression/formation protein HypE [Alphaproteobacteria bacterium]|nr:hydrogenase expression/formation protein HypE [Alphaproteobacteria bacterium]